MTDVALSLTPEELDRRAGFMAATVSYIIWGGFLPLYLKLVAFAGPAEVLGQRILWSIPAAIAAHFFMSGSWRAARARSPSSVQAEDAAHACPVVGIHLHQLGHLRLARDGQSHRRVRACLFPHAARRRRRGRRVFQGERITGLQIGALVLALAGVIVQGIALGAPPWMALALCATWCAYIIIRKRAPVPAAVGLLIETLALVPVAIGLLWWAGQQAPLAFTAGWNNAILLALAGPATAVPLMAFAFGARRVSFTTLGLLQYIAPSLQFVIGVAFGEPFTALRGASFALIWLSLCLFSWDVLRRARTPA